MQYDGGVTFDTGYSHYDKRRQAVVFYAFLRNKRITCLISQEALRDCFGLQDGATEAEVEAGCLQAFTLNRDKIEARARQYIDADIVQSYRDDDSNAQTEVNLRRKDFC